MTILLGFTIAGYNLDRIRSFRQAQESKRRRGTWNDVVEPKASVDGTESPPD
jgi:hypothetical protein